MPGYSYRVSAKIKLHTSPLRELEYEKEGVFIRETAAHYVFDEFRVRKATVIKIQEVGI